MYNCYFKYLLAFLLPGLLLVTGSRREGKSKHIAEIPVPTFNSSEIPPQSWQEHWRDHKQLVKRAFYDQDIAVYFDDKTDRSITWLFKYVGDVWRYTKKTYGNFPENPFLYVVFHTGKDKGGHPSYYFDSSHDFRNMIDCGNDSWSEEMEGIDIPTHEIFHIVESTCFGSKGSPGFGNPPMGLWGDSKFAEIYQFDVYNALGLHTEARRWYFQVLNQSSEFPKPETYWFRDWFFPIYKNHGQSKVLVNFFRLLSIHFPKDSNNMYTRSMNWGEFLHFWSGAAGINLKAQAVTAFGWSPLWEAEFIKAQREFSKIKYL